MNRIFLVLACPVAAFAADVGYLDCLKPGEALTVLMVGHTGWGKSTAIDIAAGAIPIAEATSSMKSVTTDADCYLFTYLQNADPNIHDKQWRVIDTPGSADVNGMQTDLRQQQAMTDFLQFIGKIDAVVLVFKATDRMTEEVKKSIAVARQALGPGMWSKLIIMYTFVSWFTNGFFGVSCNVIPDSFSSDVEQNEIHHEVVQGIQNYMSEVVQVPEPNCAESGRSGSTDCVPNYKQIPFVGSGASLESAYLKELGAAEYLNPESNVNKNMLGKCMTTDAIQFEKLYNLTEEAGKKNGGLYVGTNYWVECNTALLNLTQAQYVGDGEIDALVKATGHHMKLCVEGRLGMYHDMLRDNVLLVTSTKFQAKLAFALRDLGHYAMVDWGYGFSVLNSTSVRVYPDWRTYDGCWKNQSSKAACHTAVKKQCASLTNDGKVGALCTGVLTLLEVANTCTCKETNKKSDVVWSCTMSEFNGDCGENHVCFDSPFSPSTSAPKSWCRSAGVCGTAFSCDGSNEYRDPTKEYFTCESMTCTNSECCHKCVSTRVTHGCGSDELDKGHKSNWGCGFLWLAECRNCCKKASAASLANVPPAVACPRVAGLAIAITVACATFMSVMHSRARSDLGMPLLKVAT